MSVFRWIYAAWQDYNALFYRAGYWLGLKTGIAIAMTIEMFRR